MRKIAFFVTTGFVFLACGVLAQTQDPFEVEMNLERQTEGRFLRVDLQIMPDHFLYSDTVRVATGKGVELEARTTLPVVQKIDPISGLERGVIMESFRAFYRIPPGTERIDMAYQGCSERICFMPQTQTIDLREDSGARDLEDSSVSVADGWRRLADQFEVLGVAAGYMDADDFMGFLDRSEGTASGTSGGSFFARFLESPIEFMSQTGLVWTLLLILLGGLALNLTPCVLPMIPINLAIIGAGAQAKSRARGFALGGIYGLGIALVYGALGLLVVLTGSQFGELNSSPWFNLVIAVIFLILALAMFDLLSIDFTRFQGNFFSSGGSFWAVFGMGCLAALLAGACVAPVLIAVLLLSSNLYSSGVGLGLLLPFLLGLGMALPWPFAGAGLSFLPRPGGWMKVIKMVFGMLILLMALYYGGLSYKLFRYDAGARSSSLGDESRGRIANSSLKEGLEDALAKNQPVLIDFWASWCKNCTAMKKTTFQNKRLLRRLEGYAFLKYQAENQSDPSTRAVLEYYGIKGLPSFVVLKPKK